MSDYTYPTRRGTTYVVTSPSPCTVTATDLQGTSQTLLVTDGSGQRDFVAISSEVVISSDVQPSLSPSFSPASTASSGGGGGAATPTGIQLTFETVTELTDTILGKVVELITPDGVLDLSTVTAASKAGTATTTELLLSVPADASPIVTWPASWTWLVGSTPGDAPTLASGNTYRIAIQTIHRLGDASPSRIIAHLWATLDYTP